MGSESAQAPQEKERFRAVWGTSGFSPRREKQGAGTGKKPCGRAPPQPGLSTAGHAAPQPPLLPMGLWHPLYHFQVKGRAAVFDYWAFHFQGLRLKPRGSFCPVCKTLTTCGRRDWQSHLQEGCSGLAATPESEGAVVASLWDPHQGRLFVTTESSERLPAGLELGTSSPRCRADRAGCTPAPSAVSSLQPRYNPIMP